MNDMKKSSVAMTVCFLICDLCVHSQLGYLCILIELEGELSS